MVNAEILHEEIMNQLRGHPWQQYIHVMDSVDSTNTQLRIMAEAGAPQGTFLVSLEQTAGRGRQGRSFSSVRGQGLYFSLLLRPHCIPAQAGHLTLMAAVAACDAIESVVGIRPGIKWTNDLVLGNKKLSGILTEMDADWTTNSINYIIVGIGINLNHKSFDFPEDLQTIATSVRMETRKETALSSMAAALVMRFSQMSSGIVTKKDLWLQRYRQDCVTIGKEVKLLQGEKLRYAWALDVDDDGGLLVRYPGGKTETVYSGEVSVRGLYGYI